MISDSRPRVRFRPTAGLLVGLAFASPWLIGFVVFTAGPIIASAYYSLTNFDLFQLPQFVGFQNYVQLSQDPVFWQSLENTLFLTVIGLPVGLALALVCAMVLNLPVRGQPLYRAIAYLPAIVPVVVATYLWRWLFNGQYGFINQFLGALHLPQPAWLEDPAWTKPAVLIIIFWTIGTTTMIYLAALKEVPRELYEAAEVDGARWWSRFRHVTWPTITPVTLFQLIVGVIAYLQVFTQPYLIAQTPGNWNAASGGPANSIETYAMYLFQNAFNYLKMGYASAMAWILFVLTMLITLLILRSSRSWIHYGG